MNIALVNKIAFNHLSAAVASDLNNYSDLNRLHEKAARLHKMGILNDESMVNIDKVLVEEYAHDESKENGFSVKIITFVNEMHNFGFLVSKELYQYLSSLEEEDAIKACQSIIALAKENVGAHVKIKAFYPNFPRQVMEASDAELFINAIMHYWTLGTWKPEYVAENRPALTEKNSKNKISLVSMEDVKKYFFSVIASKNSIPASLVEFVEMGIEEGWAAEYKGEIPFKETLCRVATSLVKEGKSINGIIKTTTDVLRVMAALSDADIELKEKVKFKSLNRKTRRILVNALEEVINTSDVKAYEGLWKRAFHSLHVGEFGGKVAEVASRFRNEKNVVTDETIVSESIKSGRMDVAVKKLIHKPSVFARSLDKVLRDVDNKTAFWILDEFEKVVGKVDSKVLLQLLGHFKGRSVNQKEQRIVFTAGSGGRALLAPSLKHMDANVVQKAKQMIVSALMDKFAEKALLKDKKVFISNEVYSVLMPSQLASVSENKKTVARGSRIPMDIDADDMEKDVIRMFIHWIGRDQDLSAFFISEDFKTFNQIAYSELRNNLGCHSGDITYAPAPYGASEFIDLNMKEAMKKKYRYVAMSVNVYSKENFAEHEMSFAGFMLRKDVNKGQLLEPSTVKAKFDLTSKSNTTIPCFFDMKKREMIWIDTVLPKQYGVANNLHNNAANATQILKAYLNLNEIKVTMKELVELHAKSVGATLVYSKEEADFVVGLGEGDLDVYNFTEINSKWI